MNVRKKKIKQGIDPDLDSNMKKKSKLILMKKRKKELLKQKIQAQLLFFVFPGEL